MSGCDFIYFTDARDGSVSIFIISYTTIKAIGWRIITLIDYGEILAFLLNNV